MTMARMRPPSLPDLVAQGRKSPEHSGGAVPDSHRSSLFAGRTQLRMTGHQSRWRSVPIRPTLSTVPAGRRMTGKVSRGAGHEWQTLPVGKPSTVKNCGSYGAAPHEPKVRSARHCFADAHGLWAAKHNERAPSSRFVSTADSPHVPRGITVPVGQPGGDSHLRFFESRNGSTGLSQKSSWITTSG